SEKDEQKSDRPGGHKIVLAAGEAKLARRCDTCGAGQLEPGLLDKYGDDTYGPEKFTDKDQQTSGSEGEDDDVEAALKKEVGDIKASTEMRLRRFQSVESGANNVVFIRALGMDPEKLVHHVLQHMYQTKKKKTRVILRMLPISGTCRAFLEDMKKYAETFSEPWFKPPFKGTFQIVYKSRNNSHVNREEVIKELAGIVGIEIIKAVCCLSVVKDYTLFRKYNLQEVVKSAKDLSQLNPKQGNGQETKLESGDKLNQNNPAEGKNNQRVVPEISEELGQIKPTSEMQVVNEGGAKPDIVSQVTEGSKSNENDLMLKRFCIIN
uniref:THUMP domain-containing protein n=1 Tax=Microcebus murinus TaxID=30608 RepID=A0A8C5Y8T8_MICMU